MVAKKKKKYSSGEGAQFMSRTSALKKLQLSLKDFRKLCILKGIYPREPRNRKRAQKGNTGIQTLYHKKDIQFLMQEPIIWKLRDYKIFCRKIGRAKAMRDFKKMKHYLDNHPNLKLDHIVKERYPSFIDALRDLDDCLTLCFLFSTFPSLPHIPRQQFDLCRRLTIEFLHYVIEAKALRKIFVSIKGYYYQAEIKGQLITWIVPHHFSFEPQAKSEVDFQVMSTFVEFYVIMLGFVNFRLYHSLNLFYPPTLNLIENEEDTKLVDGSALTSERISALNIPLKRSVSQMEDEEVELDQFPTDASTEEIEEAKIEYAKVKVLKTLFKGLKIFINREVPREPLVFIIRCFGGEVSWDKSLFVGSTFDESNETITHQIVDRQRMDKQYISRYYIQPQWIFDSINARELLPVEKYFIGKVLPPHLSPFVDKERDETQQYIPPEEKALNDPSLRDQITGDDENTDEEEKIETNEANDEAKNYEQTKEKITQKGKLSVKPGKVYTESSIDKARREKQEYRLREKMVKNKHRKLYKSMMEGRRTRNKEVKLIRRETKAMGRKRKNSA